MQNLELNLWRMYQFLENVSVDETPIHQLTYYLLLTTMLPNKMVNEVRNRIETIRKYRQKLKELQEMPLVAQRSEEWHALRYNRLTASDVAQAIGKGKFGNRQQLLQKKAFPETAKFSMSIPPLHWGTMFEPMVSRSYSQRHGDIKIYEFGLIPDKTLKCFGASPDGITELGIMVEFKAPWKRKIDGNIPEQYELQMQGQMAVCELNECDYVECDMQTFENLEDYIASMHVDEIRDHGIIIEEFDIINGVKTHKEFYYSPEYYIPIQNSEWCDQIIKDNHNDNKVFDVYYWKLRKINIQRVYFDENRWNGIKPEIEKFWNEVEEIRNGNIVIETNTRKKYKFLNDEDE